MKFPVSYYQEAEILQFSKDLLGKYLFTNFNQCITGGMIVETEAYVGEKDRACHAYGGKCTPRTETMYKAGGIIYVYLCYGIHHLLNIVTNREGVPHVCLIRAIEPVYGLDIMLERRGKMKPDYSLTAGPGAMSQALGIRTRHNGTSLTGDEIWIEDKGIIIDEAQIKTGPRVGVSYAGEDALLPYRFSIRGNPWVSKPK